MANGASAVLVPAAGAPESTLSVGGSGLGSTLFAVVPPWFCTVIDAEKDWPLVTVTSVVVNDVTTRFGGACPAAVLPLMEAAVTEVPLLASVPVAPAAKRSVPGPLPFSVYAQV